MSVFARFIREHYLRLEQQESSSVPFDDRQQTQRHFESTQRPTVERRELCLKALRRESEARGFSLPRYFQPFAGAVILRDGEPPWGRFWIEGDWYSDEGTLSRARRIALERAHAAALREDAHRERSRPPKQQQAATLEAAEDPVLSGRAMVASIAIAGIRYEVTTKGREALKCSSTLLREEREHRPDNSRCGEVASARS